MAVINFKTADKRNYLQGNRGNEYRTFEFPKNIKNKIYVSKDKVFACVHLASYLNPHQNIRVTETPIKENINTESLP